jgi:hypothetical protein
MLFDWPLGVVVVDCVVDVGGATLLPSLVVLRADVVVIADHAGVPIATVA